jgi:integrin beta 3
MLQLYFKFGQKYFPDRGSILNISKHSVTGCFRVKLTQLCCFTVTPVVECLTNSDPTGKKYTGTQNIALTGDLCQRWDSQSPQTHRFGYLGDQGNYCRNPDGGSAPWCYTVNPEVRWSYCDIHYC